MIDAQGNAKAILEKGERKSVFTYRVVLTPGSEREQATVRSIFSDYIAGMTMWQIAHKLNASLRSDVRPRRWSQSYVRNILISETYVGTLVACTRQSRLGKKGRVKRENWLRVPNAHPAMVSIETFEAAQRVRIERLGSRPTLDTVRGHLIDIFRTHGKVTHQLLDQRTLFSRSTLLSRFGGLSQLLDTCGLPSHRPARFIDRHKIAELSTGVLGELLSMLQRHVELVAVDEKRGVVRLERVGSIQATVAYSIVEKGRLAWRISGWRSELSADVCVLVLLDKANTEIEGWLLLPREQWPAHSAFGIKALEQWISHLGESVDDIWPDLQDVFRLTREAG